MNIIMIILSALGASLIITRSFLFHKVRERLEEYEYIGKLVTCLQCSSFWTGLIFSIFSLNLIQSFMMGCTVSFFGYVIELILERVDY